jgi:Asp-tRNA(Asn)/Glu-tRNA(Gln) amidotransferase A subunit family amidase
MRESGIARGTQQAIEAPAAEDGVDLAFLGLQQQARLLAAGGVSSRELVEPALRGRLGRNFERYDAVLTPTTAKAGTTAAGLPIGAQLLGRGGDEATLLALAAAVKRAAGRPGRPPEPAVI